MSPACMTPDELAGWQRHNLQGVLTPCTDCPLTFALEMRSAGCCNGEPGPKAGAPRKHIGQQGIRYDTAEARQAARRRSWRESKARRRAAA